MFMRSKSPEDVPWTTAPELIDEFLQALDIPEGSETAADAREYARRHGFEEPIDRSPRAVAAGSIYLAHMFEAGRTLTQEQIQEQTGVSPRTVTLTYREIARAEGIAIAGDDQDEEEPEELRRNEEFGWASIAVAGVVFGLGLSAIVLLWTDVITPLVGGSPALLGTMVVPTMLLAVVALEAGLRVGGVSTR